MLRYGCEPESIAQVTQQSFRMHLKVRPISLLILIIPTEIPWLKTSREFPMDMRIPPLRIKSLLESNPPKSIICVCTGTEIGRCVSQVPTPGGHSSISLGWDVDEAPQERMHVCLLAHRCSVLCVEVRCYVSCVNTSVAVIYKKQGQ